MTTEEFNQILDETQELTSKMLQSKGEEYAKGKERDRLHNFKVAACLAGTTSEMALGGMLAKHIVSIWDLLYDSERDKFASIEIWNEKIMDSINYLSILRAIIVEKNNSITSKKEV